MGKFTITESKIPGLLIIEAKVFGDHRGFFTEFYNSEGYAELGFRDTIVQANHSSSRKGVMRGLHYQLNPHPMGKLVKAVKGSIFDVGVDIRKGSPTFGKWYGEVLSEENKKMLYFPPGFAHGFLALEDNTEAIYLCTGVYNQASERGIVWNDPDIGIDWPVKEVGEVIITDKDKAHPGVKKAETNFIFQ